MTKSNVKNINFENQAYFLWLTLLLMKPDYLSENYSSFIFKNRDRVNVDFIENF